MDHNLSNNYMSDFRIYNRRTHVQDLATCSLLDAKARGCGTFKVRILSIHKGLGTALAAPQDVAMPVDDTDMMMPDEQNQREDSGMHGCTTGEDGWVDCVVQLAGRVVQDPAGHLRWIRGPLYTSRHSAVSSLCWKKICPS